MVYTPPFHIHASFDSLILLELAKFGKDARAHLFIQLHNFPTHYLVLVVADTDFKYALVSLRSALENGTPAMIIEDIGFLDVKKVRGKGGVSGLGLGVTDEEEGVGVGGTKRKRSLGDVGGREGGAKRDGVSLGSGSFNLESDVIRELYAYCWYDVAIIFSDPYFNMISLTAHASPI